MVTETLQYYLFKLFKKISEKFANFYLTLTKTRAPLTWEKIRAILQLGRKAEIRLFLPIKFEYFIIEKLNLQKISHTATFWAEKEGVASIQ